MFNHVPTIDQRPVRTTLFPYTTLFRSSLRTRPGRAASGRGGRHGECRRAPSRRPSPACGGRSWASPRSKKLSSTPTSVDRKSTRLNSSHSQISYAVFCLKKKNKHLDKF